jgi:hypothetical protein
VRETNGGKSALDRKTCCKLRMTYLPHMPDLDESRRICRWACTCLQVLWYHVPPSEEARSSIVNSVPGLLLLYWAARTKLEQPAPTMTKFIVRLGVRAEDARPVRELKA